MKLTKFKRNLKMTKRLAKERTYKYNKQHKDKRKARQKESRNHSKARQEQPSNNRKARQTWFLPDQLIHHIRVHTESQATKIFLCLTLVSPHFSCGITTSIKTKSSTQTKAIFEGNTLEYSFQVELKYQKNIGPILQHNANRIVRAMDPHKNHLLKMPLLPMKIHPIING